MADNTGPLSGPGERTTMRQADIDGMLTFEPVPDGTRMHWSWHVRPKGPSRLLAPVINWMANARSGLYGQP